jgi:hypothetical protein
MTKYQDVDRQNGIRAPGYISQLVIQSPESAYCSCTGNNLCIRLRLKLLVRDFGKRRPDQGRSHEKIDNDLSFSYSILLTAVNQEPSPILQATLA